MVAPLCYPERAWHATAEGIFGRWRSGMDRFVALGKEPKRAPAKEKPGAGK